LLTAGFAPPIFRNHTCWAVLRTLFVNLTENHEYTMIIVDLVVFNSSADIKAITQFSVRHLVL
jgi:hypothetical protein